MSHQHAAHLLIEGVCAICAGERQVLIITAGPAGDRYTPTPCPQCGHHNTKDNR